MMLDLVPDMTLELMVELVSELNQMLDLISNLMPELILELILELISELTQTLVMGRPLTGEYSPTETALCRKRTNGSLMLSIDLFTLARERRPST